MTGAACESWARVSFLGEANRFCPAVLLHFKEIAMDNIAELTQHCRRQGYRFIENEPMSRHTSFKIGGAARLFLQPKSAGEAADMMAAAQRLGVPLLVVGRGSNLLVCDEGIGGAVLCMGEGMDEIYLEDETTVVAGAGASLNRLCVFARQHGLTGLEFAYGIPGTVGGAVYMNAGAYGGEMKDVLHSVGHLTPDGHEGSLEGEALQLGYRRSAYTDSGSCILWARLKLAKGDPDVIQAAMNDLWERRQTKQPLDYPSAGSTFKRPVGNYASALIEQCGLKGCQVGGAMVSPKHSGFIINTGGATCADVLALIEQVRGCVQQQTGYCLECEVKII